MYGTPYYVLKQGLEGKNIWRIRLDNLLEISGITQTHDSGFVVAAIVNRDPSVDFNNPFLPEEESDTIIKACILKFDKNAQLLWAKYIASPHYTLSCNIIEDSADNLYFYVYGINGADERVKKPISILKLNSTGKLLKKGSFEGSNVEIYTSPLQLLNNRMMCLMQSYYLPLSQYDTSIVYSFLGLKTIDTALNTYWSIVPGYRQRLYSSPGCFVLTNRLNCIGTLLGSNGKDSSCPFLAGYNIGNLSQTVPTMYDFHKGEGLTFAADAIAFGDSIITLGGIAPDFVHTEKAYLRLYDDNYRQISNSSNLNVSAPINYPTSLVIADKTGNFIAGTIARYSNQLDLSHIHYFDRNLNPKPWPATAPPKGYDWARTRPIPDSQVVDVDAVAVPLKVEVDNTPPDWSWLWTSIPTQHEPISSDKNWTVWPQPAESGEVIHLKNTGNPLLRNNNLNIVFYDLQGKEAGNTIAYSEGNREWSLNPGALHSGLFLAVIRNNSNQIIGEVKVIIKANHTY